MRDDILEIIGKETSRLAFRVSIPKTVDLVVAQHFVVTVTSGMSLVKGWVARVKDEKNYSDCEQIDFLCLVRLSE